jgi:hypothetical protein
MAQPAVTGPALALHTAKEFRFNPAHAVRTRREPTASPDLEEQTKDALRSFITEAVKDAKTREQAIDYHRHCFANLNLSHDAQFTSLNSYNAALDAAIAIPEVKDRYSTDEVGNLTLTFLYEYFSSSPDLSFDDNRFETVWSLFRQEIKRPEWLHYGVTILQNLTTGLGRIEIADGVAVCLRTLDHMKGIGNEELEWLKEDWMQGAHGSHALLVLVRKPKTPDNANMANSFDVVTLIHRALLAMRLFKAGDVRTGRLFMSRRAFLPTRLPGQSWMGTAIWSPGTTSTIDEADLPGLCHCYSLLQRFESTSVAAWNNINVALRRFTAIYESDWNQLEDRVIDAVTAIEALLGSDQEITFKISTRVAGILATNDNERVALFNEMKQYYEVRSKIVHGNDLKPKHLQIINDSSGLMRLVRRLLLGFIRLATSSSRFNSRTKLARDIDSWLMHMHDREELREAMGFP